MAVKADITIDIDKQVGNLQNLTNIYNARVGDNKTPLTVLWRKNSMALNLKGLHAFIAGKVGDGSYNSETDKVDFPVGTPVVKYEDDGSGTLDNGQSGLTTLLIPKQMWARTGLFAGYIGLKDENGSVFTSKDIFFKVLGNVLDAGVAINYFIGDFDKALAKAEKKLEDKSANFDQTTAEALQDLHDKYLAEAQKAEDTLGDTQAAIDNNLASFKRISASASALQAQLDADNLETQAGHYADLENLKADFDKKIGNMAKHPVQAFDSLAQLQAKYPNGTDGDFVTIDTGHIYIYSWLTNTWKDCGQYQGKDLAENSVDGSNLTAFQRTTAGSWSSPLIVDLKNSNLVVPSEGFHNLINFPTVYGVIPGTIPIITEEAKQRIAVQIANATTQAEKDQLAKTDIRSTSGGLFVVFNPDGANKLETQFKFYTDPQNIKSDEIYVGFIQFPDVANFIFPYVSSDNAYANESTDKANYLPSINAPRFDDYLYTSRKWKINFKQMTINVPVKCSYVYKHDIFNINAGEYSIKIKDYTAGVFLYLQPFYSDEDKQWYAKIISDQSPSLATNTLIYLGWVDPTIKQYFIKNMPTSVDKNAQVDFINLDKPIVDWDNLIIKMSRIWFVIINGKTYIFDQKQLDLDLSKAGNATGYYIGIDTTAVDPHNIAAMFKVSDSLDEIMEECDYFFGWVDTATKTFKFNYICDSLSTSTEDSTFPWRNKKVTCFGDSITQGDSGEGSIIPSYVPRMQKWLQTSPVNAGLCGSRITQMAGDKGYSFVGRMGSIKDQDVITIFGGINDFQWNAPLGKMSDSADTPTTFYGALKDIVLTLSKNNPKAKLMFITPMKTTKFQYHTFDENGELMKNANGDTQLDFVNAIKQVADYYSIPVLDMYSCSNYSPYLPSQVGHDNFTADGLHPTEHGYERIAQQIAKAINNL